MSEARSKILAFLSAGRNYDTAVKVIAGLILALSAIIAFSLIIFLVNGIFFMDSPTRSVLFFAWVGAIALALTRWIIWPIIRRPTLRTVAIALEKAYPELKTRLISSFDLLQIDPVRLGYSNGLVEAAVIDAGESVRGLKPSKIAPLSSLRENSAFLALALILTLGLFTAFPSTFREGMLRGMRPFSDIPRPTMTHLRVSPGDAQITKYATLEIEIDASGKLPEKVTIYRRFAGERDERGFQAENESKDHRKWRFMFEDVKRDFTYRVEGGDFIGQAYNVRVLDRPRIVNLNLILTYPNYTGLGIRKLDENEGSVDVPYGTNVTVEARFSKEVVAGKLVFADTTEKEMEIDDREGRASFRAMKNYSYHIFATDNEGLQNDDPIEYAIRVRADEFPSVEITAPAVDVQLTEELKIPLSFIAEDDYGFTKMVVAHIKQKAPEDTVRTAIPADITGKRQMGVNFLWSLDQYNLMPQDVILYWVEVYDNDILTGPKMDASKVYTARFPSIEEIIENVASERESQVSDVQKISEMERQMAKELEDIARDFRSSDDVSYERREDVRDILERQSQLIEDLEKAANEYQQTTDKMMDHHTAAQEMIEKMLEIQRLLDEVATEEMREAMKKLQEALDSMDPEELRKAVEEFQMSQEELMERLDRTLALLKRMQIEQRIEDMKKLAEALQEMQDAISEALESGELSQEQTEQMQDRITKGSELLEKGVEEMAEMMQEFDDMPAEEAQKISDSMKSDSPSQKSSQCKGNMQSGSKSQCQSQSQELSEQFEDIAQKLAEMQQKMQSEISAEVIAAIRKAVFDLLDLSARQEDILQQIGLDVRSFELSRGLVSDGTNIRSALIRVIADVADIANKDIMIPPSVLALLANANRNLDMMLGELALGRDYGAHPAGLEAMASINIAAERLLETMDQMANSSSCGGGGQSFFQKMQQMCDKQGGINQSTMPMAGGQQPGGMSPDQQAAAARLAAEQEAVQKTMEELAREAAERSDVAGRIDDIVEEMQKVVDDFRRQSVDQRTLDRQERILNRMLDVQRSLHRQEYEEQRQRRVGEDIYRKSPDSLPEDLGERTDLIQQQLLRALNQPYPKEYETHIKEYFRALREDTPPQTR